MKNQVRRLLERSDRPALIELTLRDRRAVTALNRLLFDDDPLMRWRAVAALGWVAAEDPYLLEKIISRLFYTMNDDSGSIGWMAPQALGEICASAPDLVEDFFGIIVSSLENEVFRAGALWAIGRVASVRPDLVEEIGPTVAEHLGDPAPLVRGLACRALAGIGWAEAAGLVRRLLTDPGELTVYENDRMVVKTVGEMAGAAMKTWEKT